MEPPPRLTGSGVDQVQGSVIRITKRHQAVCLPRSVWDGEEFTTQIACVDWTFLVSGSGFQVRKKYPRWSWYSCVHAGSYVVDCAEPCQTSKLKTQPGNGIITGHVEHLQLHLLGVISTPPNPATIPSSILPSSRLSLQLCHFPPGCGCKGHRDRVSTCDARIASSEDRQHAPKRVSRQDELVPGQTRMGQYLHTSKPVRLRLTCH